MSERQLIAYGASAFAIALTWYLLALALGEAKERKRAMRGKQPKAFSRVE